MGEVYRARDTKLGRDVALKVLPDTFALDADRLARFKREAQVLASLNHPHIGAIYGFEDSSETHALVLELVEGDTLADRIDRGPIPLDEALPIARQICEALEAAHEHGIIHRDLKPANIKITPDGVVKVLDFGLAKLAHPERTARAGDLTASPTITSPAMMTGVGVLLGTAAYMSPEQAKGREADKRSDVWAFGCVLYEMLTGRRPFDGEDMTEVLGAVVRLEPDWQALPSDVPPPVRTLLQQCLVKDRRRRIADIAAALFVLDHQAGVAASSTVAGSAAASHTAVAAHRGTGGRWVGGCRCRGRAHVVRHPPGDSAGRAHDDHDVRVGCVRRWRATIATSPSRPTVHASSIAVTTSCWCARSTSSSPPC